jgi:hypothetical protein
LSRASSALFSSGYFGDRVSFLSQVGLDCDPPTFGFPLLLG